MHTGTARESNAEIGAATTHFRRQLASSGRCYPAMGDERFEKWASGILGVVSLLLILNLARVFTTRWRQVLAPRVTAPTTKPAPRVARLSSPHLQEFDRAPAAKTALQPSGEAAITTRNSHARKRAGRPVARAARVRPRVDARDHPAAAKLRQAAAPSATPVPPSPPVVQLQSIGYVERADGTRQAAVAEGNRVFLVHEGDIFENHYRVLRVSPLSVEVADLATPPSDGMPATSDAPILTARQSRRAPPAASPNVTRPPVSSAYSNGSADDSLSADAPSQHRMANEDSSPQPSTPTDSAGLTTSGALWEGISPSTAAAESAPEVGLSAPSPHAQDEAASDAESVKLVRKLTLVTTKVQNSGPERLGYVEVPGKPLKTIVADGDQIHLLPVHTVVARQSQDSEPLPSQSERAASAGDASPPLQAIVGTTTGLSVGLPASRPPPAAVDASLIARRRETDGVPVADFRLTREHQAGGLIWHPPPRDFGGGRATVREVSTRAGPLSRFRSRAGPDGPEVRTFTPYCFIEKQDGSREAFISLGGEIYPVREGQIFADRFRALKISSTQVEAAVVSAEEDRSPPIAVQEIAQKNESKTSESGDHPVPQALPLSETARALAVVWPDLGVAGGRGLGAPGMVVPDRTEPTLQGGRPSTFTVPVPASSAFSCLRDRQSSGPPYLSTAGGTGAGKEWNIRTGSGPIQAVAVTRDRSDQPGPMTFVPAGKRRPTGVTELPLDLRGMTIELRGSGETAGFSDRTKGAAGTSGLSEPASKRLDKASQAAEPLAGQISGTPAAACGMSGLAAFRGPSSSGLQLLFSIGDNGCYFPR